METNTNRKHLLDLSLGARVKTTQSLAQLPKGSIGKVVEDYGTGVMVEWDNETFKDGFDKITEADLLENV